MDKQKTAILLILIGLFLFLNSFGLLSDDLILYILSLVFILSYFTLGARKHYRNIGFLIPGVLFLTIALYSDLKKIEFINNLGGGVFFLLLGLAFLLILIHTAVFEKWNWPLYPAAALIIFSLIILFIDNSSYFKKMQYLNYLIPLILIAGGSLLLYFDKK